MIVVMDETLAGSEAEAGAGEEVLSPPLSPPPGISLDFPGNFPLIFEISPILIFWEPLHFANYYWLGLLPRDLVLQPTVMLAREVDQVCVLNVAWPWGSASPCLPQT